ncbi:uncharacterized protein LOC125231901 [Leguminivora glycinivorella]|uniref:uncharacterized protein LOC125231901 n=1 Tax=Leguminivora glycinivorella TaxID=1035111 RepID=UPI00200C4B40|nr:uncharacterized protein LOC125231901 [Leguminivora glycinivorella]
MPDGSKEQLRPCMQKCEMKKPEYQPAKMMLRTEQHWMLKVVIITRVAQSSPHTNELVITEKRRQRSQIALSSRLIDNKRTLYHLGEIPVGSLIWITWPLRLI